HVIGPLFTSLPLTHYLTSAGPQDYVAGKLLMLPVDPRLPGVFTSNPLAAANSSLWTLPVEVKAYVLVAVLGLLGAFRRRWCVWAAWLLCVRSEEHTSELQSHLNLVCRLLLEKKKKITRERINQLR